MKFFQTTGSAFNAAIDVIFGYQPLLNVCRYCRPACISHQAKFLEPFASGPIECRESLMEYAIHSVDASVNPHETKSLFHGIKISDDSRLVIFGSATGNNHFGRSVVVFLVPTAKFLACRYVKWLYHCDGKFTDFLILGSAKHFIMAKIYIASSSQSTRLETTRAEMMRLYLYSRKLPSGLRLPGVSEPCPLSMRCFLCVAS